jgi:hypothetical protein
MRHLAVRVFTLLVLGTFCSAINPADSPVKGVGRKKVIIRVLQDTERAPESCLLLVATPSGELSDIMSHPVTDDELEKLIAVQKRRTGRFALELKFASEEKASVVEMTRVVNRIKSHTPDDEEVILYLRFKEFVR